MLLSTLQGISADGKGAEILPLASGEFDAQKKLLSTIRKAGGKHGEKQFKELMILSNRGLLAHVRCSQAYVEMVKAQAEATEAKPEATEAKPEATEAKPEKVRGKK